MTHIINKPENHIYPVQSKDNGVVWMEEVHTPEGTIELRRAANDSLYDMLERRYGGGFAQWIIDGLKD